MVVSKFVQQQNRLVVYGLMRLFGGTINLYKQGTKDTDLETGEITWTGREVITIRRALILPNKIQRTQTQTISTISMDKAFVYGGSYDTDERWFYIDPRVLPVGYVIKSDDWIVYDNKKYEIKQIKNNEFDTLWEIQGTELIGVVPEQIHNLSGYSIVDFQQSGSL